nr:CD209 antigen-like protein C [Misgurnus anguillicaudatus]
MSDTSVLILSFTSNCLFIKINTKTTFSFSRVKMFDYNVQELTEVIYESVSSTEFQRMKTDRMKLMLEICHDVRDEDFRTDSNTTRHQPLQCTVTVCLVLLCVLLLTAVIVLCVLINTNNQQFNIKTKNIKEERDQLLTKYTNITEERDQLLTKKHNLTEERDELLAKCNNTTKLSEQLKEKNKLWTQLYDGWIYYQSNLYFISSEKKNWSESRKYCREREADLIIINNKEEQDFIKKNFGKDGLWIGLSDSAVEGRWKWVDGSTLNSRFWRSGEPNGGREENCVLSSSSGWADFLCNDAFQWICEKAQ